LKKKKNPKEEWEEEQWYEAEKKAILETSGPLCLDPSLDVVLTSNGKLFFFLLAFFGNLI